MPLVLAAIDLKLSPSCQETAIRQQRLDCFTKIIRYSELQYDVTDFVAAGTNHLLQLAYTTTQTFFLPRGCGKNGNCASKSAPDRLNYVGQFQDRDLSTLSRVKSWPDAFLRDPTAYLLISNSVDYSLSVGRLPCTSNLPISVRNIEMGIAATSPWTIHTCTVTGAIGAHLERQVLSGNFCRLGTVDLEDKTHEVGTETSEPILLSQKSPQMVCMTAVPFPGISDTYYPDENSSIYPRCSDDQRIQIDESLVNLDFLDFGDKLDGHI